MTYCVGVKLEEGLILASDSRTHAGVDNYAKFCKMTVFERAGDRVLVLLSSGGLAATQAVVNVLRKQAAADPPHISLRVLVGMGGFIDVDVAAGVRAQQQHLEIDADLLQQLAELTFTLDVGWWK